jgi:hypothetical protein
MTRTQQIALGMISLILAVAIARPLLRLLGRNEDPRESLSAVESRITVVANRFGWKSAEIPLKSGLTVEAVAGDHPTPHEQKSIYQYRTPSGYLGLFVYHQEGRVDCAHLFYFFSDSDGVSDLQQQFRFHTPLSIRGGTAMEGWLRGTDVPWDLDQNPQS